jgi:hypothetical protein
MQRESSRTVNTCSRLVIPAFKRSCSLRRKRRPIRCHTHLTAAFFSRCKTDWNETETWVAESTGSLQDITERKIVDLNAAYRNDHFHIPSCGYLYRSDYPCTFISGLVHPHAKKNRCNHIAREPNGHRVGGLTLSEVVEHHRSKRKTVI